MTTPDRPRVLLLWPGGLFGSGRNFGVPHLLSIAAAIRASTDALVDLVDLDFERAFGGDSLARLAARRYDLVGISCYSSFDYLKVMAIGARLRRALPDAWLVTGGYHPSARPADFTRADSPFDYVVVGDGEGPMSSLVAAFARGARPPEPIRPHEPLATLGGPLRADYHLLDRYRPFARELASQAEVYLSRGCPFGCAFCMEKAKRCTAWRAMDPSEAVDELHRLDAYLDLTSWTLFVSDALFGMEQAWRRTFLEALARRPIRARKVWVLTRLDALDREDIGLMARANVAPGFGLESGDPGMLETMGKTRRGEAYLEQLASVASWARERQVPFGVNLIVGHPGETEESIRRTAAYLRRVFLEKDASPGFVSVDPFRLYPGSEIDANLPRWIDATGMRVHRYPWWHDGDQDFLAEWVDPSFSLDFRATLRLRRELFGPIVVEVQRRFGYDGVARDYFERAAREQVDLLAPKRILRTLGLWHLWTMLTSERSEGQVRDAVTADEELRDVARDARIEAIASSGIEGSAEVIRALLDVPRERFVRLDDLACSADDRAVVLVDSGQATVSAMHAYARTFDALQLGPGDHVVDLGTGSGYGAAIAAQVVGPEGRVLGLEIDEGLASWARANLAHLRNVQVLSADAHDTRVWTGALKVAVGFAIEAIPAPWIDALVEGGVIVAPVGLAGRQQLTRVVRTAKGVEVERLGDVRYVADRSSQPTRKQS